MLLLPFRKYFGWWYTIIIWYARDEIAPGLYVRHVTLWFVVGTVISYIAYALFFIIVYKVTLRQLVAEVPAIVSYENVWLAVFLVTAFLSGRIARLCYRHRETLFMPWAVSMFFEDIPPKQKSVPK